MKELVRQQQSYRWGKRAAAVMVAAALAAAVTALPVSAAAGAQEPDTPALQYVSTVSNSKGSYFYGVTTAADGGTIAVGSASTSSDGDLNGQPGSSSQGLLLSKFDAGGKLSWTYKLGFSSSSVSGHLSSVTRLKDGTYLAVGYISSIRTTPFTITESTPSDTQSWTITPYKTDAVLVYFDENGTVSNLQALTGSSSDNYSAVKATPDGGFAVLGSSSSSDGDFQDLISGQFIRKYKSDGAGNYVIDWTKCQQGYSYSAIDVASDGNITAVGNQSRGGTPFDDSGNPITTGINTADSAYNLCAAEISYKDGTNIWQTWYPGGTGDAASGVGEDYFGVTPTSDGGLLAVGDTTSPNFLINGKDIAKEGANDFLITKYAKTGAVEWMKHYGGAGIDQLYNAVQQPDGSYVLAGYTFSNDQDLSGSLRILKGKGDHVLVKLHSDGSLSWVTGLQGSNAEISSSTNCLLLKGSSYIVAGYSNSTDGDFINDGNTTGTYFGYVASFSYDLDGDGVPNTRDYFPDDASKSLSADPDNVYDLTVTPATSFGSSDKSSVTISRGDYDYAGDGTATSITDNTKVTAGAFSAVMPEGVLDNLFHISGASNDKLTFGVADSTASVSVSGEKVLYAGDITVKDADGNKLDTSSLGADVAVTLTIPAGSGYDASKSPKVVHIKDDGSVEDVSGASITQNADGSLTITFTTDHFSTYAVVQTADTTNGGGSGDGNGGTDTTGGSGTDTTVSNPATGSPNGDPALYILLGLVGTGAAGTAMVTIRRRRHN